MQAIYTYIPETNYLPREYSVAAILLLLFMVHTSLAPVFNLLYFYISTFCSMYAVPNMAVFCSSLTSWFPGMLLMYFMNDWNSPCRPCYYWCLICFYIPHVLYFCCKVFIFQNLLGLFFLSYFCLLRLQYVLTYMLSFCYRVLWCLVCYWGWFCLLTLVDSTVWLPCLLGLLLLFFVHVHTSVFLSIFTCFLAYVEV
jgi:hypothetical protein